MPAVAAVRSTARNVSLATEADDAVTAAATLDEYARAIMEHSSEDRSPTRAGSEADLCG